MTYSVGDVAAHLTRLSGGYVGTHRVFRVVLRLIETGRLEERRAGRFRIILEKDLPVIEEAFGLKRVGHASGDAL